MKRRIFSWRNVPVLLPALYLIGAVPVWIGFATAPPDGLANIWIVLYTFPIVIAGSYVLQLDFPYLPGGYYQAHALYFWPSVALLAGLLFLVCCGVAKLIGSRRPPDCGISNPMPTKSHRN